MLRRQAADHLELVLGQPPARRASARPSDAEQVASSAGALQVAHQHRVHLVLLARALLDQLRPARDASTQHARLLVGDPHLGQKAAGEQLRQRPRVDLVGLRRRVAPFTAFGFASTTRADMRLEDPRDRERVAGRLQHHLVVAPQAPANSSSASGSVATRPASRTLPASAIATSQKSRCTSNPM